MTHEDDIKRVMLPRNYGKSYYYNSLFLESIKSKLKEGDSCTIKKQGGVLIAIFDKDDKS